MADPVIYPYEMDTIRPADAVSRLAIFDIDGTLTDSTAVDDECYRDAVAEALGVDAALVDWTGALHVTDAGILRWLWSAHRSGEPSADDYERARSGFVTRITRALEADRARCVPIPGALEMLRALGRSGWCIAAATGGWGPSARLKLRVAGIELPHAVLACADDAETRVEIVSLARRRAEEYFGRSFERVVSIGDGVWDVAAARQLGLPFIGIASGERADRLRAVGAEVVLPDYADLRAFERALDSPGSAAARAGP